MKNRGLGLGSILTIIFVIAKLIGIFTYSWLWVFSPLWIPIVLLILLPLIGSAAIIVATIIAALAVLFRKD